MGLNKGTYTWISSPLLHIGLRGEEESGVTGKNSDRTINYRNTKASVLLGIILMHFRLSTITFTRKATIGNVILSLEGNTALTGNTYLRRSDRV